MIYFMSPTDGGPVKIGRTDNLDRRREQLETHYGCQLAVLATIEGGKPEEREVHRRFKHLRLGRTEQFRPGADLMAFIGRPLLVGPNPDAVEAIEPRRINNTRPIRLDLPPNVHRMLRLIAADEGVSMAAFARNFLSRHLCEEAKRRGIK